MNKDFTIMLLLFLLNKDLHYIKFLNKYLLLSTKYKILLILLNKDFTATNTTIFQQKFTFY